MMRGIILDATAPLYGRADKILKIDPLLPGWISNAFSTTPTESIKLYSIFGGVPRYWELVKDCKTVNAALKQLVLDKNGILHDEPIRLLLDDMRSAAQPYSILTLIGNGCNRLSEIAARLGKPATSLARPLTTLIDLGYIRRELPFDENVKSTKRSLYKINDPFLNFYFTHVLPHKSLLQMGLTDKIYSTIKKDLSKYISTIWEDLARQSVPYMNLNNIQWGQAARWWGNTGENNTPVEIDIVAESMDKKHLLVGEAKWGEKNDLNRLTLRIENIVSSLPFVKGRKVITAYWLKQYSGRKSTRNIITPSDVLKYLK